jgi:hypothetical protein
MITHKQVEVTRRALLAQRDKLVAELHNLDGALQILTVLQQDSKLRSAVQSNPAQEQ